MSTRSFSTLGLLSLAALAFSASPLPARADDVVVSEDALVAAAKRIEESTVVLRVTRSPSTASFLARWMSDALGAVEATPAAPAKPVDARGVPVPGAVPAPAVPATPSTPAGGIVVGDRSLELARARVAAQRLTAASGTVAWGAPSLSSLGAGVFPARGFFVGDGKTLVTAAGAVDGASKIEIVLSDGPVEAFVTGIDRDFDVAILRSAVSGAPLEIDAGSNLEPGRMVIVTGAGAGGTGVDVRAISSRGGASPRRGYGRLAAALPAGALGGPALGPDGRVRGLVVGAMGMAPHAVSGMACSQCHNTTAGGAAAASRAFEMLRLARVQATPTDVVRLGFTNEEGKLEARLVPADGSGGWTMQLGGGAATMEPVAHLVPGRRLARAIGDLLATGKVKKAYLGLVLGGAEKEGDAVDEQRVGRVLPGSPCEGALRVGDRIVAVGERRIGPADDLTYEILALEPGKTATLSIARKGEDGRVAETTVEVVPQERQDDASATGPRVFGFEAVPLSPELRAWLGTEDDGVVVSAVRAGGAAERAGARRGDRIVRLAGRDVKTTADLAAAVDDALRRLATGEPVVLDVVREGKPLALTLLAK